MNKGTSVLTFTFVYQGREAIKAIVMDHPEAVWYWDKKAFSGLYNLRLLSIRSKVHLPQGLEYLPDNLRFFKWRGYPLRSFPPNFNLFKLVELNMCHGNIELLWKGDQVRRVLHFCPLPHIIDFSACLVTVFVFCYFSSFT